MPTQQEMDEFIRLRLAREAAQQRLQGATEAPPPQMGAEAVNELKGSLGGLEAEDRAQRDSYLRQMLQARQRDANLGMIAAGGAAAMRFSGKDASPYAKQMASSENEDRVRADQKAFGDWLGGRQKRAETIGDASIKAGGIDAQTYNARLDALQMAAQSATGAEKAAIQAQIDRLKESNATRHDRAMEGIGWMNAQTNRTEAAAKAAEKAAGGEKKKQLVAGTVDDFAGISSALGQIDEFSKYWDENAAGKGASISAKFPGTKANEFEKGRTPYLKAIAKGMEGNRLTDNDMVFYDSVVPSSKHLPGQKKAAIESMRKNALVKYGALIQQYEGSGYDVESQKKDYAKLLEKYGDQAPAEGEAPQQAAGAEQFLSTEQVKRLKARGKLP